MPIYDHVKFMTSPVTVRQSEKDIEMTFIPNVLHSKVYDIPSIKQSEKDIEMAFIPNVLQMYGRGFPKFL